MKKKGSTSNIKSNYKTQADSYPKWSRIKPFHILSIAVIGVLFFTGFKIYKNANFFTKKNQLSQIDANSQTILKRFPANTIIKNNKLFYNCKKITNISRITRIYYDHSYVFKPNDLKLAIRSKNPNAFTKSDCKKDALVLIPNPVLKPIVNSPLAWSVKKPIKAVYFQGGNVQPNRTTREVAILKKRNINSIVFDVKDIIGVVNYRSQIKQVERIRKHRPPIKNIHKVIHFLHSNDIYIIARMALFQDENLANAMPSFAIRDTSSPDGRLLVKGKPLWVDPGNIGVHRYNLAIVEELVKMGVDEIQFDYVRYPAEGSLKNVRYQNVKKASDKTDHIVNFLKAAWLQTRMTNVKISIDIFGIVAWGEEVDVRATGQRIERLASWVDIISPMLYPSHFNSGFDGFKKPADEGLHFYHIGVKKVLERSKSNPHLVVRPWIQAFKWRVTNYNESYIRKQIRGSYMGGGSGWLMWNAGNNYKIVYSALKDGHPEGETDINSNKSRLTLDQ